MFKSGCHAKTSPVEVRTRTRREMETEFPCSVFGLQLLGVSVPVLNLQGTEYLTGSQQSWRGPKGVDKLNGLNPFALLISHILQQT